MRSFLAEKLLIALVGTGQQCIWSGDLLTRAHLPPDLLSLLPPLTSRKPLSDSITFKAHSHGLPPKRWPEETRGCSAALHGPMGPWHPGADWLAGLGLHRLITGSLARRPRPQVTLEENGGWPGISPTQPLPAPALHDGGDSGRPLFSSHAHGDHRRYSSSVHCGTTGPGNGPAAARTLTSVPPRPQSANGAGLRRDSGAGGGLTRAMLRSACRPPTGTRSTWR